MTKDNAESMRAIALRCFETSKEHGWWEEFEGRDLTSAEVAMKLCLIHSEVSEALEDVRTGNMEVGLNTAGKPEGFPSELADIIIRVFDLCGFMGIDITKVVRQKMLYNHTRSYKHGGKKL